MGGQYRRASQKLAKPTKREIASEMYLFLSRESSRSILDSINAASSEKSQKMLLRPKSEKGNFFLRLLGFRTKQSLGKVVKYGNY